MLRSTSFGLRSRARDKSEEKRNRPTETFASSKEEASVRVELKVHGTPPVHQINMVREQEDREIS